MFDIGADAYYKITKPIRLIELFAGIGSQAKALTNLGFKFEHYRICEFDKYAVQSYNAIHGTNFETSDITKISSTDLGIEETDKYEYIMTYSFPCTDLSLAGKREGMARGSGTRSGLLWEIERLLGETTELPQILLMENVPQVLNRDFGGWLEFLEKLGYHNYYELLNAKNYGIPQNRNRCFMVSVLGDYYYEFPKPINLELRLRDMLENNVAKKYYLSDKMMDYCTDMTNRKGFIRGERFKPHNIEDEYAFAITTNAGSRATDNFIKEPLIAAMRGRGVENKQQLETGGELSNTITTVQKDNLVLEPTLIQVAQLDGYESSGRIYSPDGLAPTINTMGGGQESLK
jgi:DNA (cytosine-5)-methyltransferase 1